MYLAQVIGHIEARTRVDSLHAERLWLLQPLDLLTRQPIRWITIAADCTNAANLGSLVLYVEGREAANPFPKTPPLDATITALVDTINLPT